MNDLDISDTIKPKTDQLNADDLISGPKTLTFTNARKTGSPDQPFSLNFEGDNGKPYKPSLGMRRVLVKMWGANAAEYVGRSVTVYNDPDVTFGKDKVGGIRISHMSHIERTASFALTVSKARRKQFTVQPLKIQTPEKKQHETLPDDEGADLCAFAVSTAHGGTDAYKQWFMGLTPPEKHHLNSHQDPDPNDFDKMKPVHDLCKEIAVNADNQESGNNDEY